MAVLGVLGDGAAHAAVGVLLELHERGVEVDGVPGAFDDLLEHDVARRLPPEAGDLLLGEEVRRVLVGALLGPVGSLAAGELERVVIGLVLGDIGHEVVHGRRLVDPHAHDALVALAAGIAADLGEQLAAVDRLAARLLGGGGVDGAVPVARVLHDAGALDQAEVEPVLGGVGARGAAGVARAHDQNVGVPGLGDERLVDLGLGAQPVLGALVVPLHGLGDLLALGLGDALGRRRHGAVAGHRGAGDDVDRAVLLGDEGVLQRGGEHAADPGRLARDVDDGLGDGGLVEGQRDRDGAHAGAGRRVGARGVRGGGGVGQGGGGAGERGGTEDDGGALDEVPAGDGV